MNTIILNKFDTYSEIMPDHCMIKTRISINSEILNKF